MSQASDRYREKEYSRRRKRFLLPLVYVLTEAVFLAVLKTMEIRGVYPEVQTALMYGAIVLNTAVLLLSFLQYYELKSEEGYSEVPGIQRRTVFISLALFFTLAADTVLVLLNRYYLLGVLLFCVVQTFYALAVGTGIRDWLVRIGNFLLLAGGLVLLRMGTALNIASAYSITQLALNALGAWILLKRSKESGNEEENRSAFMLLTAGLILFFCCDVCVGIYNLSFGVPGLKTISESAGFLMWVFYLPSQVLLVLSGRRFLFGEL